MNDERRMRELYAGHDGELSPWRRWLWKRRLARDPAARRELETVREIGALMREEASGTRVPDLWTGIEAQLPYAEAPTRRRTNGTTADAASDTTFGLGPLPIWAGAGLVAAAMALVLYAGSGTGDGPLPGSVQWLDSGGRATMILQDDAEATIIWLLPETAQAEPAHGRIDHGLV